MKNIVKILIATIGVALIFTACHKEGDLPIYKTGNGTVLSSSATSVASAVADSNKTALTLTWTWPNYATDSANQKFIVEIDSTGHNFASPVSRTLLGVLSTSFTAKELNTIIFGFGATKSEPYSLEIRLISSYANNNELYKSNSVTVDVTPYIIPVTLTLDPVGPLTLEMTNANNTAVTCNWNATQYGNQALNYAVQMQLTGGDWTSPIVKSFGSATTGSYTVTDLNKAALNAGILPNTTGTLDIRVIAYQGTNFENPLYSNVASLTVTTYLDNVKFWVVGSYNGWDNSDNALFIANTPETGSEAQGYVNFETAGEFKLTTDHSWDNPHTFGDDGTNTGKLANPGGNIAVATPGYYLIKADPVTMTYSLTLTTWGIIGDATPGGWGDQTNMTYNPTLMNFWIGTHLTANSIKFRGTSDWSINYGANAGSNALVKDGPNISVDLEADYFITLDLSHPNAYTYSSNRWGVIGSATANGWDSDQNMTWDATNKVLTATLDLTAGEIKFRANDDWGINYGGDINALSLNGANIAIASAGTYVITLDLNKAAPSCTITPAKK
jgi:hypothetical protein